MTEEKTDNLSIKGAIANTAEFFHEIEEAFGIPPAVTMDILRFHMMYTMQNAQMPTEETPEDE